MDSDLTEAEAMRDLTVIGMEPVVVSVEDYALVPCRYELRPLEQFKPAPNRITANPAFQSLESFVAYVRKHNNKETAVFMAVDGSATAVIDQHGKDEPHWGSHRASYQPKKSERWDLWTAACKRTFSQRELAEFIEDNIADFLAPTGGDMLTTAKTLIIKKDVHFKSDVRCDNGDVNLEYAETTKAGRGEVPIPTQITISIPVLESETPRDVAVRLKYRLDAGVVTFFLAIKQHAALLDDVKRYIYATIKNETSILPYLGNP